MLHTCRFLSLRPAAESFFLRFRFSDSTIIPRNKTLGKAFTYSNPFSRHGDDRYIHSMTSSTTVDHQPNFLHNNDNHGGSSFTTSPNHPKQAAIADLFYNYAHDAKDGQGHLLSLEGCRDLLSSIGERPDDITLRQMFDKWDLDSSGKLDLYEFLKASGEILQEAPARIVLVVGGPGSGKGILCQRLAQECHVVHLSSGDLLREEVLRDTPLGRECAEIMKRGELVSSAVITSLIRKYMKDYPGRRVLLDGFPRSLENAQDFLDLMGTPELALHLECDDTILMERIMKRGKQIGNGENEQGNSSKETTPSTSPTSTTATTSTTTNNSSSSTPLRSDDNFETAIRRLRTYHKSHKQTMDWLREHHIPIVNLDCSGTPENVWNQLLAIGRLMRPMASLQEVSIFPAHISSSSTDSIGGGSTSDMSKSKP